MDHLYFILSFLKYGLLINDVTQIVKHCRVVVQITFIVQQKIDCSINYEDGNPIPHFSLPKIMSDHKNADPSFYDWLRKPFIFAQRLLRAEYVNIDINIFEVCG